MTERHTLLHEAGHVVIGDILGWKCNGVSVQPGEWSNGVTRHLPPKAPPGTFTPAVVTRPLVTWPENARRLLEAHAMILMAGDAAQEILGDPGTRLPDTAAEQIAEQVAELPEPGEQERAELAAMANDPDMPSDEDQSPKLVWAAHHGDLASASAWLDYLYRQVRQLVIANADAIRWFADVLEAEPVLTGEAVMALLRGRP